MAERDPSWSPDGRWIAYLSDASGEYELYVMQSDGKAESRRLTHDGGRYRYTGSWSPDSKLITFSDKSGALFVHDVASGETTLVDTDPWSNPISANWSHDSQWLAYAKSGSNRNGAIWLYNVGSKEKHRVTSGMFQDSLPTFDRKGDYLFFASNRKFDAPIYEDAGTTFVYTDTDVLVVVPLRDEVGSPWAPESDAETWDDADTPGEGDKDAADKDDDSEAGADGDSDSADADEDDDKDEEIEPVKIDIEGFERRALPVPVDAGSFRRLAVTDDGKLIYSRSKVHGAGDGASIYIFDLEDKDKEEKTVVDGAGMFVMSSDGKKLLVRKDSTWAIVDAKADQKLDKPLTMKNLFTMVDRRAEWRQMFVDAWRIERDFFYDPNMHGVDWPMIGTHYVAMLTDCSSREDLTYVIGEMISELNVGHAYARSGGDLEKEPKVSVGMLGVDFALENGAYRIAGLREGAPWDLHARGPLGQPGVDVHEGDYLLAVNGVPVDTRMDPWASFQGMGGETVTITVSDKPVVDDDARDVVVDLLSSESKLRFRDWVEHNRRYVEQKTDGKVGYIYVPDTGRNGQNELFRQFYGQIDRKALIIDERCNGGGQIPTRFVELLNRPATNYWARRDGNDWPWPPDAQQGPKCMLINGLAGSGGDAFPYYFRQAGVGKLIGMRTWGGLVGISGNPTLIDGGRITSPTFAFYETDGTWGIEGHGVDPDIEVVDDPSKMTDGGDPQLDAAIAHMLSEMKKDGYHAPRRPAYPDRSGMGVTKDDR